jgi:hypothetical protein
MSANDGNDEAKKAKAVTTLPAVDGFDGFEDRAEGGDDDGRVTVGGGDIVKFSNEAAWEFRDGTQLSPELELIAVESCALW